MSLFQDLGEGNDANDLGTNISVSRTILKKWLSRPICTSIVLHCVWIHLRSKLSKLSWHHLRRVCNFPEKSDVLITSQLFVI